MKRASQPIRVRAARPLAGQPRRIRAETTAKYARNIPSSLMPEGNVARYAFVIRRFAWQV